MLTGVAPRTTVTKVYISGGRLDGVKLGDRFYVKRWQTELIDPGLGSSLGSAELNVALVEVIDAQTEFSVCKILTSTGGVQRGDRVVQFTGDFIPTELFDN